MHEAQEFAYLKIEELVEEFKRIYPGPYLDMSSKGYTLKTLLECLDKLAE